MIHLTIFEVELEQVCENIMALLLRVNRANVLLRELKLEVLKDPLVRHVWIEGLIEVASLG